MRSPVAILDNILLGGSMRNAIDINCSQNQAIMGGSFMGHGADFDSKIAKFRGFIMWFRWVNKANDTNDLAVVDVGSVAESMRQTCEA